MSKFRESSMNSYEDSSANSNDISNTMLSGQPLKRSGKKKDELSNILNEIQMSKSLIQNRLPANNIPANRNPPSHSKSLNYETGNLSINQSYLYRENSQSLADIDKLNEYSKMKEKCLWEHFEFKDNIQQVSELLLFLHTPPF